MKSLLWIFAVLAGLSTATSASAQEPQGDWRGVLPVPGGQLRMVIHIQKGADGRYTGAMDVPDQGAKDIPLGSIVADGQTLEFEAPSIRGRYRATWDPSLNRWKGQWAQGAALPLNLVRSSEATTCHGNPTVAGLDGDWTGAIGLGALRLRAVFHIKTANGVTTATMDSPDQGKTGSPVSSIACTGDDVKLELNSTGGAFEGSLAADGQTLVGRWTQAGNVVPLTLARHPAGSTSSVRPQTPARPYPYREEEVTYQNAASNVRLAGTLTIPRGNGPFPAVVLVAGSGPNDRNETAFGHEIFKVLADHLTRSGIAALRFDKRGIAGSTGDFATATTADFAADAEAGIAYLKTRSEINPSSIGLIGHSEGGLIAPMVAARNSSVAFIVMMAGPALRFDEIEFAQTRLVAKAAGASEAAIEESVAVNRRLYAAVASAHNTAEAAAAAREIILASKPPGTSDAAIEARIRIASSNWLRFLLNYDPAPALQQVKCPVLAINGSKDLQVPPAEDLAMIRKALASNPDAEVRELPGLNHLFQTAKTGAPQEYSEIDETMAPSALDLISGWIKKHTT